MAISQSAFEDRTVNPEDEIFWRQVRQAYNMVSVKRENAISIELAGKRADIEASSDIVIIMVTEVAQPPTADALIVPPGSTILDPRDT